MKPSGTWKTGILTIPSPGRFEYLQFTLFNGRSRLSMNESVQAPRGMEIIVGLVCGLIGLGLLSFVSFLSYKVIERGETTQPIILTLTIMAVVGGLFAFFSYRLVLNRGAKIGGGLFSPTAWHVAGTIFAGLAVMLTIGAISQRKWVILVSSACAIIFAKLCFSSAKTRSTKSVPSS
jgi:hypothetical protein